MFDVLSQSPALAAAFALVFGLLIGSFLNVVILRVPRMLEIQWQQEAAELRGETSEPVAPFNLVTPRSRCNACGHEILPWENIPVLSWLFLRGRCSACGTGISARYPLIELATGLLSALAIWRFGLTWMGAAALVLTFFLIALTVIDLDTQLLPDNMTLPLLWLGLGLNVWAVVVPLEEAVLGAMLGYGLLWSVYWAFKLATGKEGMGYGDFKLLGALGAWFGWKAIPAIVLASSVVGAVIGIGLIVLARRGREVPIPFGPYLAGGGMLALYFRDVVNALIGL